MFATGDAHILWSRLIGALRLTFSSNHSKLSKVLLQWQLLELLPRKVRLPQDVDLAFKIFGKGKAQKSEEREKIRKKIDIRIGTVTQLSGDVVEDMEIALFIEAIVAKALLTLYCATESWMDLGTDEALQADYARLQPKHGTSDDDDTKTIQGDEKDQAATGKRITRTAPKATEVKADTEEPRPQAPRPAATGTLPIPLGHPPQGARDLGFPPEFQHWLDEDISRRPPPYPYGRENTEHLHLEGLKIL